MSRQRVAPGLGVKPTKANSGLEDGGMGMRAGPCPNCNYFGSLLGYGMDMGYYWDNMAYDW